MFQRALGFHPQKLYPRYAKLAAVAARTKPTFELFRATLPFAMSSRPAQTDKVNDQVLADTAIAIIGFPRTGTTFLHFALEGICANVHSVYKNHNVRAIPLFSSIGTPVLVTPRNPLDTCISWSFYHQDDVAEALAIRRLNTYLAWHRILKRKISSPVVHLVNFDDFTSTLDNLPKDIWDRIDAPVPSAATDISSLRDELSYQQKSEGMALEVRNTPSAARESATLGYRELYAQLEQHQVMRKCNSIYEELSAH